MRLDGVSRSLSARVWRLDPAWWHLSQAQHRLVAEGGLVGRFGGLLKRAKGQVGGLKVLIVSQFHLYNYRSQGV